MTYTISHFGNDTTPALSDLDQNFDAAFLLTPVPCSVAGTNALVFTQNAAGQAASGTIAAYANGLQICGVAAQTNTTAVTAQLGALPVLNVYKDAQGSGVLLAGNEIQQNAALTLRYDSTLNSGAGGWRLIASTCIYGSAIVPSLVRASIGVQYGSQTAPTVTGIITAQATLAYSALVPNATQDQTFTVADLLSTDGLMMALPLPVSTGLTFSSYFTAGSTVTGTVTVRCANVTAASTITPGTITVGLKGIRTVG